MKTITGILIFCITMSSSFAASLQDVTVLDLKFKEDSYVLKLQDKTGPRDSYFFIDVVKEDEQAFEKLALVLKKIKHKDEFKLNLKIPSFSSYPSGSYYRSGSVKFLGSVKGESLIGE